MYPDGVPGVVARRVALRSGLTVRIVESGPPTGSPVLLIPGWGGSAYLYSRNIGALADAGLRALVLELPGQGGSDKPRDPSVYTLGPLTESVFDAMDALEIEHVALVGQSFGGRVAIEAAFRRPSRITRLALIGAVGLGAVFLDRLLRLVMPLVPPSVGVFLVKRPIIRAVVSLAVANGRALTSRDMDEFAASAKDPAFARALVVTLRHMERAPVSLDRLDSLGVPLLAISGERDRIVHIGKTRDWIRRHGVIVPGAGHLTNFEAPEAVNRELVRFLSRR